MWKNKPNDAPMSCCAACAPRATYLLVAGCRAGCLTEVGRAKRKKSGPVSTFNECTDHAGAKVQVEQLSRRSRL